MKKFDVKGHAAASGGEFILGAKDTGTHACYMIYGTLKAGEEGRLIRPGAGHEEIVMAVRGDIEVTGAFNGTLKEGEAFLIQGADECLLHVKNAQEAAYLASGGHTPGGKHSH